MSGLGSGAKAAVLFASLALSACGVFGGDTANERGIGRKAEHPEVFHDDPGVTGINTRRPYDEMYNDPFGAFDDNPDEEPSVRRQRSLQRANELYSRARHDLDAGHLRLAKAGLLECLRFQTEVDAPAREMMAEVDAAIRKQGGNPNAVELSPEERERVRGTAADILDRQHHAERLLRTGEYDKAAEAFDYALLACKELPDTLSRLDLRFHLQALANQCRRMSFETRAKATAR